MDTPICPWCRKPVAIITREIAGVEGPLVFCRCDNDKCNFDTWNTRPWRTREEAVRAWNAWMEPIPKGETNMIEVEAPVKSQSGSG